MYEKPTSQSYYEKLFETTNLNWEEIYILPRKVSIDTNLRIFGNVEENEDLLKIFWNKYIIGIFIVIFPF